MTRIPPRSYEDIINLPRPECRRPTRLSAMSRAGQFAPFAALTGFEDSIDETARRTSLASPTPDEDDFCDSPAGLSSVLRSLRAKEALAAAGT